MKQYYAGTPFIPKLIMLPYEIEDKEVIEEWLSGKRGQKVYVKIPQKGMKEKLVELANKNAKTGTLQDKEKLKREEGRTIGALKEICRIVRTSFRDACRSIRYFEYQWFSVCRIDGCL